MNKLRSLIFLMFCLQSLYPLSAFESFQLCGLLSHLPQIISYGAKTSKLRRATGSQQIPGHPCHVFRSRLPKGKTLVTCQTGNSGYLKLSSKKLKFRCWKVGGAGGFIILRAKPHNIQNISNKTKLYYKTEEEGEEKLK